MTKCPYCGRTLREYERYCDFCGQDISKTVDKAEKPNIPKPRNLKEDIRKVKDISKTVFRNIKKKLKKEK